ncbi:MAG: Single-stranded DNA-binding protein [Microgenomates group bacterium GW2011_GWC1_44_23]|nr:MAG: Single-stranded DNA-binding protein [Microgenomates group bacterium GW2011_GWC1_44_23]
MSTRSLNRVTLIGNLTRDPELKYTPQGTAVGTFSIATNREWTDSSGQKQEGVEFHRIELRTARTDK